MKLILALVLALAASAAADPKPTPKVSVEKSRVRLPDTIDEADALRAQLALVEMQAAEARMNAASKDLQIKQFLWEQVKKMLLERFAIDVDRGDDWQPQPGGKWKIVRKQEVRK